jgi:hypothetical protein
MKLLTKEIIKKLPPFGLKIERDLYFKPKPLEEL